jgi:protein-S-isoprenylcysteine O-methyltransferase
MNIGVVLLIVSAMWVASEIALLFSRRSDARSKSQDFGSLIWLNAVIYGSAAVSVYIRFSGVGTIPGVGATLAWVGLVFILLGLAIRWAAILTLRQYFTVNVAIQPDHRIVRKGLYGFVRHPAYSGTIISFLGLGLALGNWISLAVLLIFIIGAFIRRIQIEERALVLEFGSEYEEYSRTTWRLIPWLY